MNSLRELSGIGGGATGKSASLGSSLKFWMGHQCRFLASTNQASGSTGDGYSCGWCPCGTVLNPWSATTMAGGLFELQVLLDRNDVLGTNESC